MPRPALVSTATSWPGATSSFTEAGVRPTRYSWTFISFGTPTRISLSVIADLSRVYSGRRGPCRRCARSGPVLDRAPPWQGPGRERRKWDLCVLTDERHPSPRAARRPPGRAPSPIEPRRARRLGDRDRLRRYRHQPDLRLPRDLLRPSRAAQRPGRDTGRLKPDLLVDDDRGDDQICRRDHARRQ